MKKFLAVLLSLLTVFSLFAMSASAVTTAFIEQFPEYESFARMIEYKKDTLDGVQMVYQAGNTLVLGDSKYAAISEDTPIAIDHDFICWADKKGNKYYPGDIIKVEGKVTLYAVWAKKTDSDSHTLRVIKAGLSALIRIIQSMLGVYDDAKDFDDAYWESKYNETNGITTTTAVLVS